MILLPGLIDPHVHVREPGATHKEDWKTATMAAIAGGFTTILAMPNTKPPITNSDTLDLALQSAAQKAHCDYAQFLGAGAENTHLTTSLAPRSAGLKMYLDQTYGPLRLDHMSLWMEHFRAWPEGYPIVAHAEDRSIAAILFIAHLFDRSVHIAHVARKEEIILIRAAKEKGIKVTCEVGPHHLFLSEADFSVNGGRLSTGRAEVRPRLASPEDQRALWENMDIIDCFATDHAPHTVQEKEGQNPPPGFPGLETALPLLLTAVHTGRLNLEDIITRCYTNPRKIFKLPEQPQTSVEIDPDEDWEINASSLYSRCGWTPFDGLRVRGRVTRVVLRGQTAFESGKILNLPGSGLDVRQNQNDND